MSLSIDKFINKREYYRVYLNDPLNLKLTIHQVLDKIVNKPVGNFPILNISAGGLSFSSPLKLYDNPEITYRFIFFINGNTYEVNGVIVRKSFEKENYLYGVRFLIPPFQKQELLADIHQLACYNKRFGKNESKYKHY